MACHAPVPHSIRDIEFACRGLQVEEGPRETQFVGVFAAADMHALFVERHEYRAIDTAVPRKLKCATKTFKRRFSALRGHPPYRRVLDTFDL